MARLWLFLTLFLVSSVYSLKELELEDIVEKEYTTRSVDYDDETEQQARFSNIIVTGWPEEKGRQENTMAVVYRIGRRLKFNRPLDDVLGARRVNLRLRDPNVPRPIVIRLRSPIKRGQWCFAYNTGDHFKQKWYLNEHLSQHNQKLLRDTKKWAKQHGWKYVWTRDCIVRIKKGDGAGAEYQIKQREDLDKLLVLEVSAHLNQTHSNDK
uniref:FP protein C-terminal domain-containing protein n=1 Tax=Cacopsylla melanoneura TaxID=428564 RepID=A0A8D8LXI4_9HEMI